MSGGPQPTSGVSMPFGATVTILFSDIRGFTEYTEQYGDEAAFRILRQHSALVHKEIEAFGGRVVKTQGDSFMVYFTPARAAILCAIAIQRLVGEETVGQQGTRIAIGIGINTGEPIQEGGDFFGSTVNLAARICAAAGPGQVLISETTRYVAGRIEAVDYIDSGLRELKGFQEPQRVFEVNWGSPDARGSVGGQISREIRAELGALAERFSRLGTEMLDTSRAMRDAGPPPSDGLARQLASLNSAFTDFRARLVQRAAALGVDAGTPEGIATLVDAEPILAAIQEVEGRGLDGAAAVGVTADKHALEVAVQRALAVLTRVLVIGHRDDAAFHPLLECQAKASDLRLKLSRAMSGESEYTPQRLEAAILPFSDLITLVVGHEQLDDERFTKIEDGVTRAFGRPLALAAARGRLSIDGLESPGPGVASAAAPATPAASATRSAPPAPPARVEERKEPARPAPGAEAPLTPEPATTLPSIDPRGAGVPWWAAASEAWRTWKASGIATAHALRAVIAKHPYLLAVPVRRSHEYDEGRVASDYFLLLEHVENVFPTFIRNALNDAIATTDGSTDPRVLEPALYERLIVRGRLRETFPEFVRDVMIAAIPTPGVSLDGSITEHDDATVIVRWVAGASGAGAEQKERLTEQKERLAEHRFVVRAGPLTARFIAVRRGDLKDMRDVEVRVTEGDAPSDAAWILTLRSDHMLQAPPKRHTPPVTAMPGLAKSYGGLWIGVFNADPTSDREFAVTLALRPEVKMSGPRRPSVFGASGAR